MIPVEERRRRLVFARNRSCLLFGVSWSHHPSFGARKTHFYFGAWTLTLITFDELLERRFYGRGIKEFYIDNAELLLQRLCGHVHRRAGRLHRLTTGRVRDGAE